MLALLILEYLLFVALFFFVFLPKTSKIYFSFKNHFIMNSGSKVLLGVLAGAATGAILGVLFAPDKGMETRRRISDGSRDISENLKDKFSEFVDGLADKYETVKGSATDLIEQGKAKATNVANALKSDAAGTVAAGAQATANGAQATADRASSYQS
jgi:gas vesicle protein